MPETKEQKKPLDMTTEEAMEYLFPKEVVKELKNVANPEIQEQNQPDSSDDVGESLPCEEE